MGNRDLPILQSCFNFTFIKEHCSDFEYIKSLALIQPCGRDMLSCLLHSFTSTSPHPYLRHSSLTLTFSSRKAKLLLIKSWQRVYKHKDKPGQGEEWGCGAGGGGAAGRDLPIQRVSHPLFALTGSRTRFPTVPLPA